MLTQSLINSFFKLSPNAVVDCAGNVVMPSLPPLPSPPPPTFMTEWVTIDEKYGVAGNSYAINRMGQVKNIKFNKIMKQYLCPSNGYMCVSLNRATDASGNRIRPNSGYGRKPTLEIPRKESLMLVHRLVAKVFIPNSNPHHKIIDHIDGNQLNNNYRNLRWASNRLNSNNAKNNRRFWGVGYLKHLKKWAGSIQTTINNNPDETKNHYVGSFDTEEQAAAAVKAFMLENYPNEMGGGRRFID